MESGDASELETVFEISKIRMRRAKKLVLYSLAIYGGFSFLRGCSQGTYGGELTPSCIQPYGEKQLYVVQNHDAHESMPGNLEKTIEVQLHGP